MKSGFTLIELSLSIVFISILSIIIVLLINNSITSYRRGMTLNNINTVGMDLVDEMRMVVQSSPSGAVIRLCDDFENEETQNNCRNDNGRKFVSAVLSGDIELDGEGAHVPLLGAFCTGSYSYIWNSGYFFNIKVEGVTAFSAVAYKLGDSETSKPLESGDKFKLVKVKDKNRNACRNLVNDKYEVELTGDSGQISIGEVNGAPELEELLASGSGSLAIYDFSAMAPAMNESGEASFYSMSFILGTVQGGINVVASGNFCKTRPADEGENFDYCAINKFNFAAQAIGKG